MPLKTKNVQWRWLLLPLFLLLAIALWSLLTSYTSTDKERLYLTPIFSDANGWDIYTIAGETRTNLAPKELMELKPFESFYLSRTLTDEWSEGGYTFLLLDSQRPASIFLDGKLLYTTSPDAGDTIGKIAFPATYQGLPQRGESVRFTLPGNLAGKTLTIATAHPACGATMPGVRLSGEATEAEVWMATANHTAMPAAVFAIVALLLIGLLFYNIFVGNHDWSLLLLTATAFCQLFYCLRQYAFSSPAPTALDTPLAAFIPMLAILLPELYLLLKMKRRKKLYGVFLLISAVFSFVPPVANLFGSPKFSTTPFLETLYIGLVALLVFSVLELREKNRVFQLFLSALCGILACSAVGFAVSRLGTGFIANYVISLIDQVARHDPMLFFYWCGIVLFALTSAISVYSVIQSTADTQTQLALQIERLARLDYELVIQKQIYEAKLTGEQEVRALRHDMKGHLTTLSTLLSDGNSEKAVSYLADLSSQHQSIQSEVYCTNSYMNAVLTSFHRRFKDAHIKFICKAGVTSETLPGVELCLILTNALENALEASLLLPEEQRIVKLQARVWHGQFLLRVSNAFDGALHQHDGLPVSSKTEKGHGYGMANILSTAKRLDGEMNYLLEDGCFVLDVRFPVQEEQMV